MGSSANNYVVYRNERLNHSINSGLLAKDKLAELVLYDKLKLSDIPFDVRADVRVYKRALIAALTTAALTTDSFDDTVKLIMSDILEIAKKPKSYLYIYELHDIIDWLKSEMEIAFKFYEEHDKTFFDKNKFLEETYKPFAKSLMLLVGMDFLKEVFKDSLET